MSAARRHDEREEFARTFLALGPEAPTILPGWGAEELLERAWDENADPFTNVVRVTVMTLRKKLGDPPVIQTVPGAGYRL